MKIKKRTLKIAGLILAFLIAAIIIARMSNHAPKEEWKIDYHKRPVPKYEIMLDNGSGDVDIYTVVYDSRPFLNHPTKIHALLFMPRTNKPVPGLVLVPGGGVTKEGEFPLALQISRWGYSVLTMDTRGVGETGGYYLSYSDDQKEYEKGNEPIQHLTVYDTLVSFDVMTRIKGIDGKNAALAGESMGGRYSIIASAIEPKIKGLIAISTAGYRIDPSANKYLLSIDPDKYIGDVPGQIFFLHGTNDTVIPIKDAQATYSLAKNARFFAAEGCGHGYCKAMQEELHSDLQKIFGE